MSCDLDKQHQRGTKKSKPLSFIPDKVCLTTQEHSELTISASCNFRGVFTHYSSSVNTVHAEKVEQTLDTVAGRSAGQEASIHWQGHSIGHAALITEQE